MNRLTKNKLKKLEKLFPGLVLHKEQMAARKSPHRYPRKYEFDQFDVKISKYYTDKDWKMLSSHYRADHVEEAREKGFGEAWLIYQKDWNLYFPCDMEVMPPEDFYGCYLERFT